MRRTRLWVGGLMTVVLTGIGNYANAAAVKCAIEGTTLKIAADRLKVAYNAAQDTLAAECPPVSIVGKGALVRISPQAGGKVKLENFKGVVKPGAVVKLRPSDWLAARVALSAKQPITVIALLNPQTERAVCRVPLDAMGLSAKGVFAGYALVENEFIGPIIDSLSRSVAGRQCALIALGEATNRPVLLCTSRTIEKGADDLADVKWSADGKTLLGTSSVIKNKRYELRLFAPPEPMRWVCASASVSQDDAKAGVTTEIMQTRQWLRVFVDSPETRRVRWRIQFAQKPPRKPRRLNVRLSATAVSFRTVRLRCYATGGEVFIRRNDGLVFPPANGRLDDTWVIPGAAYTYTAHPVSWRGTTPAVAKATVKVPEAPLRPPLPDVYLSEIPCVRGSCGWGGDPRKNTSIEGNPIRLRGEVFRKGMGVHAVSELVYDIDPLYRRFVALVGVDDEKGAGSVTFEVYADGKPLFKSGPVRREDEIANIDVEIPKGAKQLRLVVGNAGDGIGCDHADWATAGFVTLNHRIPPKPPARPAPGFAVLFSGKDRKGWIGDPKVWSVREGVIHGEVAGSKDKRGSALFVWNGGKVRDFVLKLKFRLLKGNAGVRFRGKDIGHGQISGYRAEIAPAPAGAGMLCDTRRGGPIASLGDFVTIDEKGRRQVVAQVADEAALLKANYYKPNDWNEYTIAARGNYLVQQVNGFETVQLIDNDRRGFTREGVLALEVQNNAPTVVEFKDVWLRPLKANYGRAIRLFNGKDMDGWTFSSDKLKGTWGVKSGALVNQGRPHGYLRTTADYTNYTLRLQMRHLTKGNSGVLLRMVGPDKVWPRSIEAQGMRGSMGDIFNIGNFPMKTDPSRTRGRHTPKMHPSNEKPLGEWNVYEITLDGGNLQIRVNGLLQNAAKECWETPGKICLQSEGAKTEFRNIVLVPILRAAKK